MPKRGFLSAALVAGCLSLTMGCGSAPVPESASPQVPVTAQPASSGPADGPEPVKPTGDAVNPHKVRWTSAKPVSKGRKVKLVWWSGVAPCSVLDRVKVKETTKRVTITLYEGTAPKAVNASCIMIAIEKTTTVKLRKPLGNRKLVDGAKN
ncbi:hypothetical protein [Nonomuraea sp. NPDC046570]|uniref:hypothetical protein n=1 Tax=Nonomuraea sp. NPDC046570 TaxID=3155255 RepID=UPI0033F5C918